MDKFNGITSFNIVLYQPEIPSNTGNIGRLCLGTNAALHIIKPMRFLISDKYLKRAGLDYWDELNISYYDNIEELYSSMQHNRIFLCSTKGKNRYDKTEYKQGDTFVFGPESRGLPNDLLNKYAEQVITIPMSDKIRSINLCNSVSIILYEAWKQNDFTLS